MREAGRSDVWTRNDVDYSFLSYGLWGDLRRLRNSRLSNFGDSGEAIVFIDITHLPWVI